MSNARQAVVTIYTGDYLDRIRHLEALAAAERESVPTEESRLASDVPEYLRIAEEHEALVSEAKAKAIHVRVQAQRRSGWKKLIGDHPPRSDDDTPKHVRQADATVGVNEETLKEDLVPASVVEIEEAGEKRVWSSMSEGERADFLDDLADVDFDRIYYTAFGLNRMPEADPKDNLVSRLSQRRDETSN